MGVRVAAGRQSSEGENEDGGIRDSAPPMTIRVGSRPRVVVTFVVHLYLDFVYQPSVETTERVGIGTRVDVYADASRGTGLAEEGLERAATRVVTQLEQRLLLDLTHTLTRDLEQGADVLERHRIGTVETEVQSQNL